MPTILDEKSAPPPPPPSPKRRQTCWGQYHDPVPWRERRELDATEPSVAKQLARRWSASKKCLVLAAMAVVLLHAHLSATMLYAGDYNDDDMAAELGVPAADAAALGNAAYLLALAAGGMLWAPWSEEYGRRGVLVASTMLGALGGLIGVRTTNLIGVLVARVIGGLSAGGSAVALAVANDLFGPYDRGFPYASLFLSAAVVSGSALGPIVGPAIALVAAWPSYTWMQIFGSLGVATLCFLTPETRSTVILDSIASRGRRTGRLGAAVYGPNELDVGRDAQHDYVAMARRPLAMLFSEPALVAAALLPAISNGLMAVLVGYLPGIYVERWGFGEDLAAPAAVSAPLLIGCVLGCVLLVPAARLGNAWRRGKYDSEWGHYESRLLWSVVLSPGLPLGLLAIAVTVWPPGDAPHWIGPVVGMCVAGLGNFALFACAMEYALRLYGPYAASAAAIMGLVRSVFAGALIPASLPMRRNMNAAGATSALLALAGPLWFAILCLAFCACCLRNRSRLHLAVADASLFVDDGVVHFLPDIPGCRARTQTVLIRVEGPYRARVGRVLGARRVGREDASPEDLELLAALDRPSPAVTRFRLWMGATVGPEFCRWTGNCARVPADPPRYDDLSSFERLIDLAGTARR